MRIVRLDDGGVTRLLLHGELDIATGDDFEEQVARVFTDRPQELVVDLGGLTFCDSSGIDVLLAARETAQRAGIVFRVMRPCGIVLRSLTVTGVLEMLTKDPAAGPQVAGGRP